MEVARNHPNNRFSRITGKPVITRENKKISPLPIWSRCELKNDRLDNRLLIQ
jgi:hypothetical protein